MPQDDESRTSKAIYWTGELVQAVLLTAIGSIVLTLLIKPLLFTTP